MSTFNGDANVLLIFLSIKIRVLSLPACGISSRHSQEKSLVDGYVGRSRVIHQVRLPPLLVFVHRGI